MHDVLNAFMFTGCNSAYLSDLVIATSDIPSRYRLTSANTKCYEQLPTRLKFAEHSLMLELGL